MQRRSKPLAWHPKGLSDTLDATTDFTGSMAVLTNLIPDPTTSELWQARPAAVGLVNFATGGGSFSGAFSPAFQIGYFSGSAGNISVFKIVGDFVYGMMGVTSGTLAGYDAPFCFNLTTGLPVVVTGTQSTTTLPLSQPTTGAWTPPQMDVIGAYAVVASAGFVGPNFIGYFNIATPSAPVWNAGTLTATGGGSSLTQAPTAVAQFSGRAYYIQNLASQPAVLFSDSLDPFTSTNQENVLTFNDNQALTALGKLPLNNQLGGIIQSLMVFKDNSNIFQITGDPTTNNLLVNSLNCATGTSAPNSVCSTPKGLIFMAVDGFRLIDFNGNVSDPIGVDGSGICVPFIYAVVPSRVCAACNSSVVRISVQNGYAAGSPNQEYWYDFSRKVWSGPHSFPFALIAPYKKTFIGVPIVNESSLWQSDFFQSSTSIFTENGSQLTWEWQTPLLPDTDQITNNEMHESTLDMSLLSITSPITIVALNQNSSVIATCSVVAPGTATVWGAFTWGAAPWGSTNANLQPYTLPWPEPIVFARMFIQASGTSAQGFRIGSLYMRYGMLRTLTNTAAAA